MFGLILIFLSNATLVIKNNQSQIVNEYKWYSKANVGIPYGSIRTGRIEFTNSDLCQNLNIILQPKFTVWLLAYRGNCPLQIQVLNAQNNGYQLLIFINPTSMHLFEYFHLINSSIGNKAIKIPSILVHAHHGKELIDHIASQEIIGTIQFTYSITEFIIGINIENKVVFPFLREFKPYFDRIRDKIQFRIFYEFLDWSNLQDDDCYGNGRYCLPRPDGKGLGRDVVKSQLDQSYLFMLNQSQWWDFVTRFDEICTEPYRYQQCMQDFVDDDVYKLVQTATSIFYEYGTPDYTSQHVYLENQLGLDEVSGIIFFPGLSINGDIINSLNAEDIFQHICDKLESEDIYCCQQVDEIHHISNYCILIVLVLVFAIGFIISIALIKKKIKTEMKQSIEEQIKLVT